ncbi:MAG: tetratricopeptide repeat protein [FCB group bacterium]|nr:tetratricopeptide repeat protein [FCB group bacterium]
MMRPIFIFVLAVILCGGTAAEDYVSLNEKGNDAFAEKKFEKALEYYHNAEIEKPETPKIQYNHANTLLETGRFEEAVQKYNDALSSDDVSLQSRIHYNTGNGYFGRQDYQKAVEEYQKTLDLNPNDLDAKHNLELARIRLKEQQQNQQEQEKQDQENQDQEQEQKQEQEQQDQQDQEEEKQQQQDKGEQEKEEQEQQQQQQNEEQENKEEEQQPQPQEPKEDEMSKEDAERILNSLADQEKADLQKRKIKITGSYKGSDW